MGFDSWNWENHKEVFSSVAKASSFPELLERQMVFLFVFLNHSLYELEFLFPSCFYCDLPATSLGGIPAKMIIWVLSLILEDHKWEWRGVK